MLNNLKLVVFPNIKDLGNKVDEHLRKINSCDSFIADMTVNRFSNGEGKVVIDETIREKDLYVLSDVGNYSEKYQFHGMDHYMSPDEHFQDIKRFISATSGQASKITVIMPLLYESRQHRRKGRESLDCALALQELEKLGVSNIITFDVHDPNIVNAVPNLAFDNFYPTNIILEELYKTCDTSDMLVISPDMGAVERARHYAERLKCDVGLFYKRRDLTKVVNGKNPIVEHVYLGRDVKDKNILIVDDMVASGGSMIETAESLKKRGAKNIYIACAFALFSSGYEHFDKAYKDGLFNKLFATNLSYVPEEIKKKEWFKDVDCSLLLARVIDKLNKKESISSIYDEGDK